MTRKLTLLLIILLLVAGAVSTAKSGDQAEIRISEGPTSENVSP